MDANGARALLARIELDHWRQSEAVRNGRQPETDPDAHCLVGVEDDVRVYAGGAEKRLVAGAWRPVALGRSDVPA